MYLCIVEEYINKLEIKKTHTNKEQKQSKRDLLLHKCIKSTKIYPKGSILI